MRVLVWLSSDETSVQGCRLPTSHCIFRWWKEGKRALWLPFFKVTNTIHKGPAHMPKLPPKDLTS